MAEAVEPRARAYIYVHRNQVWEKRDNLRRRHAAGLQDQSSGCLLVSRTSPRCAGVLWASLMLAARSVQSSSSLLKAGLHCIFYVPQGPWRHACSMKTRVDIVQHMSVRAVPPAGLVGATDSHHREPCRRPESASNSSPPSPCPPQPLLTSELGHLSLPRGREGVPQRLLRHRAGPTHQLGGVRYAVDRGRPPSPPGRAGTRGYLREPQTHA